MSNTYTKGYSNGVALTEGMLDTAYQTLQLDIANTALTTTGSTTGQGLLSNGSGVAASFQTIPDPMGPFALRNYGLKATVATGVMTVSLKTKAGATPSGSDIVDFNYSTNGTTSVTYTSIQITTATTLAINASASLGYTATSTSRIFVYGYYNSSATAVKLAVSARSDFDGIGSIATTAMSASADSKMVLYASAALTVVPRLLGHIDAAHNSGGNWQTPTKVNIENVSPGNRGVLISSSSGSWSNTSLTASAVTNLSNVLITTGRPVVITLIPDGDTGLENTGFIATSTTGTSAQAEFLIYRDSTIISQHHIGVQASGNGSNNLNLALPPGALFFVDIPPAGTYTYTIRGKRTSGSVSSNQSIGVARCCLLTYEL